MTDPVLKRRCAVYTSKSTEEGLEAFNSPDAQREACEAYVSSQRVQTADGAREPLNRRVEIGFQ